MMRIAFLTNRTTSMSLPVLKRLAALPQCELVHIFFYDTLQRHRGTLRRNIREFGWSGLMRKAVRVVSSQTRMLVLSQMGSSERWAQTNYEFARLRKISHSVISDLNHIETRSQLVGCKIDLLIVAICKNILGAEVLQIPSLGAINIHPSLLPSYRGPAPAFWVLYHGESETGVTFHRMTTKIDAGEIVGQYRFHVKKGWGEDEINRHAFELAAERIAEVLDRLKRNEPFISGDNQERVASYFTYPTSAQRRELLSRSVRV